MFVELLVLNMKNILVYNTPLIVLLGVCPCVQRPGRWTAR